MQDDLKFKYSKREEVVAEKLWTRVYEESRSWDEKNDKGARVLTIRILSGSLIPIWDQIHEVVQRASARGGLGVTASQANMKVVRMSAEGQHFIGLRLPLAVILSVKKQLDNHANILAGKVLKVTMDPSTLAAVPAYIANHYLQAGTYKGKAMVGKHPSEVIMHFFGGNVTLGLKHMVFIYVRRRASLWWCV